MAGLILLPRKKLAYLIKTKKSSKGFARGLKGTSGFPDATASGERGTYDRRRAKPPGSLHPEGDRVIGPLLASLLVLRVTGRVQKRRPPKN